MTEAEERYLTKIADNCREILGSGIDLLDVQRDSRGGRVRLIARYRLADAVWQTAAAGDSVVAAHAALRALLLVDRLRLGFSALA